MGILSLLIPIPFCQVLLVLPVFAPAMCSKCPLNMAIKNGELEAKHNRTNRSDGISSRHPPQWISFGMCQSILRHASWVSSVLGAWMNVNLIRPNLHRHSHNWSLWIWIG